MYVEMRPYGFVECILRDSCGADDTKKSCFIGGLTKQSQNCLEYQCDFCFNMEKTGVFYSMHKVTMIFIFAVLIQYGTSKRFNST